MPSWLGASPAIAPMKGPAQNAPTIKASTAFGDAMPPLNINTHKAKHAGDTKDRRRLSNIFQRLMARMG